jgi:two-component system, NarL family, invasion response regulator UvrY
MKKNDRTSAKETMLKILIADDHPIVRTGLKQILDEAPVKLACEEAKDGHEVLRKTAGQDFDLILLDIAMPGVNGLDCLKQIKKENPRLPVLIISMYPEEQYAVRALKAGASGYLTKQSAPDELLLAIKKVLSGGKYVSALLAEKMAWQLEKDGAEHPHETLSDREYEVLRLIASGKTASQIAAQLCLSVKTVSTYRTRILEKMKLKNNAELTHYAVRNHLVD